MKIAYLSTFYPFRGGIAQFNAAMYRNYEKEHHIKAFTFTRQYPNILFPGKSQMVAEDDNSDAINSLQILDSINPLTYIKTAKTISKFKPDLMITKFWMPFFAPSLGWVSGSLKRKGTAVVSILDNVIPHEKRPGDIALIKYFLNRNSGFVVMSSQVKNDLLALQPKAQFIEVAHPLYDHFGNKISKEKAREHLSIPNNKKVLLFFGFIRSYKGLDILIDTLSMLSDDYILIIAGEMYGDFKDYDLQIAKLGLEDRIVKNVRYISDQQVPIFFSAADCCVLPYKSATQSGITSISFHFDLPVVATDIGGLKEMIEPHQTGIMADKPDASALKTAIENFFQPGISEKLIKNIKEYKKQFSWENLANRIIEFAQAHIS